MNVVATLEHNPCRMSSSRTIAEIAVGIPHHDAESKADLDRPLNTIIVDQMTMLRTVARFVNSRLNDGL